MTNLEKIKTLYSAFENDDWEKVHEIVHPQVRWTEMAGGPLGGTYVGLAEVEQEVFVKAKSEYDKWENYQVQVDEFIDGTESIVVLGSYSGKYLPTQKQMHARYAHVWKLKDGKVIEMNQYADTEKLNAPYRE